MRQTKEGASRRPKKRRQQAAREPARNQLALLERLGAALATERARRNLSQAELAELAKVSRNIISNIETGKNYEIKQFIKVYETLGLAPPELSEELAPYQEFWRKIEELLSGPAAYRETLMLTVDAMYEHATRQWRLSSGGSSDPGGRQEPRQALAALPADDTSPKSI